MRNDKREVKVRRQQKLKKWKKKIEEQEPFTKHDEIKGSQRENDDIIRDRK